MNKEEIKKLIKPNNGIEEAIICDLNFIEGVNWGKVRNGHPEAQVIYHIKEVLANIDKYYKNDEDYNNLRLIAILHDSFKYKVDRSKPRVGENHHGMLARRFAEKYIKNQDLLLIIEHHDDAYNAWQKGGRHHDWYQAGKRATKLIISLSESDILDLYVKFYRCDNATGDKSQENYDWFIGLIK